MGVEDGLGVAGRARRPLHEGGVRLTPGGAVERADAFGPNQRDGADRIHGAFDFGLRRTRVRYTTPAAPGKEARVADGPSITDDGVARLRARIGVPQPHPQPPHYRCPNEDAFRLVAESYGDDNPLWCDPAYAAATRWHG